MTIRRSLLAAGVAVLSLHCAASMYAVTLRGAQGTPGGKLYEVDASDASARPISSFELDGEMIGLRGIAIHPRTGVFYGITAGLNRKFARALVTFNPRNGKAKLIGALGYLGSDLNFDSSGTLYAWLPELDQLGVVDLGTGKATPLMASGLAETIGGGFAIREHAAVISASSGAGTLDRVDLETGRVVTGPPLSGAPYVSAIVAMDFAPDGQLYAVNTNLGTPASAVLVRIDPANGQVTRIGPLPDDAMAIAFGNDDEGTAPMLHTRVDVGMPWLLGLALAGLLCSFVAGLAVGRWRVSRRQLR